MTFIIPISFLYVSRIQPLPPTAMAMATATTRMAPSCFFGPLTTSHTLSQHSSRCDPFKNYSRPLLSTLQWFPILRRMKVKFL